MYRLGVDLGGTNIAVGLVDENFNIVCKKSVPTGAERGAEPIVEDMAKVCIAICEEMNVPLKDIVCVGIATPGIANYETGYVEYTNNIPFVKFPIGPLLSEKLGGVKVFIENDANAAALGEAVAGAARGTKSSVMITLGTGVGGGVIIDGKVFSGFNYAGPELGHMVIERGGRPCTCGRSGCWEAYSSATALIKMTREKLDECVKNGEKTVMTSLVEKAGKVTGRTAFDAMREGDKAGSEVVDLYLSYLITGLVNIVNIFQPEVISLGGGVSNEGQWLVDRIYPLIYKEQYGSGIVKSTELRIAKLKNDAGIIGAAMLG